MMDNEGTAGIAILLWSIGFHAGMFIAAGIDKPVGMMLMACSTAILIFALAADARLQAEKKRHNKWIENQNKVIIEALEELKNARHSNSER